MITFPNCKINLGLRVLRKRQDGYHDIETVFYPVQWCDCLEILEADSFGINLSGRQIDGDPNNNLIAKAYQILKEEYDLPAVQVYLRKNIPMGAGLGGGSADGAFMLKLLNDHFDLEISDDDLEQKAKLLGSDCPFFIRNKPILATGTGTDFSSTDLNLSGKQIMIIYPGVHVSTAAAYGGLTPSDTGESLATTITKPIESWKAEMKNDFEESVFKLHPEIEKLKSRLYDCGAEYASMSGSGSAVFGIFTAGAKLSEAIAGLKFPKEDIFIGKL